MFNIFKDKSMFAKFFLLSIPAMMCIFAIYTSVPVLHAASSIDEEIAIYRKHKKELYENLSEEAKQELKSKRKKLRGNKDKSGTLVPLENPVSNS